MVSFWENTIRYLRFFITSLLGLLLILAQPVLFLLKNTKNIYGKIFIFLIVLLTGEILAKILNLMIEI